jgi:adenosylcobinamide-GDP ribazoletransferase
MTLATLETDRKTTGFLGDCRSVAVSLCAALQFLTIFPALVRRPFTAGELGWSIAFFPLVGLLLGGMLLGLERLLQLFFPAAVSVPVVLTAWVLLTGALHVDGFLDTCDGVFGGRTPEERLRIMRDEHVGAFAVIGGILLVLLKYSSLTALADRDAALLLAPVMARWAIVLAIILFPYARVEGLGRDMKDHAGWRQGILASVMAAAVAWLVGRPWGLVALAVALVGLLTCAAFVLRRLPGLTGDVYGFICEVCEILVLLTLVAGEGA